MVAGEIFEKYIVVRLVPCGLKRHLTLQARIGAEWRNMTWAKWPPACYKTWHTLPLRATSRVSSPNSTQSFHNLVQYPLFAATRTINPPRLHHCYRDTGSFAFTQKPHLLRFNGGRWTQLRWKALIENHVFGSYLTFNVKPIIRYVYISLQNH